MSERLLDRAGRRRSPATMPGFHAGHAPGNKGLRYPADPPKLEEIVAVRRAAGDRAHGRRLRTDGNPVAIKAPHPRSARAHRRRPRSPPRLAPGPERQGRAPPRGRHGRMGMGTTPALARHAARTPDGPLFCVINGTTRGRHWSPAAARAELRRIAAAAGVRRRFAPHQLRHAHAVEMAREGRAADCDPAPTRTQQPASTSKASTAARSSKPSTRDAHRCSPVSLSLRL